MVDIVSDAHNESLGNYAMFYPPEYSTRVRLLSDQENALRIQVERHGIQGVWSRDLRKLVSMSQATFTKAIKALEARQFIKSFKPVSNKSKKMYIAFDREPSPEMTGGPWYSNGEFDADFANIIETLAFHKILEAPRTAAELLDLCAAVSDVLSVDIIQSVVDTLVYDGRVRKQPGKIGEAARYCAVVHHVDFFAMPCDTCRYFKECSADNPKINPSTCQPFRDWFAINNDALPSASASTAGNMRVDE